MSKNQAPGHVSLCDVGELVDQPRAYRGSLVGVDGGPDRPHVPLSAEQRSSVSSQSVQKVPIGDGSRARGDFVLERLGFKCHTGGEDPLTRFSDAHDLAAVLHERVERWVSAQAMTGEPGGVVAVQDEVERAIAELDGLMSQRLTETQEGASEAAANAGAALWQSLMAQEQKAVAR